MVAAPPASGFAGARGWFVGKGPTVRRALRAAVVVPSAFAIGSQVIGNAQTATFSAFGAFALLLFVEFPGNRAARFAEFALLGITGVVLIVIGTFLAKPAWLAVVAMAVIGFVVLFAGVVSSVTAAAGRAALLTFILPVMLPGSTSDIPARLFGWAIAVGIAVPVALYIWPPQEQNQLRTRAAATCQALASMLALQQPLTGAGDSRVAVTRTVSELRAAFRASAARPVALSTGSRLLMRLVDELEWLTTTVINACADAPEDWPEQGQRLRAACADALRSCAEVLAHGGAGPTAEGCAQLDLCISRLTDARSAVSAETLDELRGSARVGVVAPSEPGSISAGEFERPLYAAHELGYIVELTAVTVSSIAAADSRSWLSRLLGRRPSGLAYGEAGAAERIAAGHLDWHSVWLQNSVRGAVGLAAAVLIARISGQQQGFWIVLAALSVLRSNALSTGATVLRAILGTVVGIVIGGLLIFAIGTDPTILWILLPFAVFVAAFAPEAISFAAGQAAFTVVVIILFNIIAPLGWRIGVVRIEDIALGCLASIAAGLLFWPRGAGAALGLALADAYRSGGDYLRDSVEYLTGRREFAPDVKASANASSGRLDDALRQYLAERGAKNVPLESLTTLTNGAGRLALAGTAVNRLHITLPPAVDDDLAVPSGLLVDQTERLSSWYSALGEVLAGRSQSLPAVESAAPDDSFLDVLLPAVNRCHDSDRAEQAERLLWSGQYVGDLNRLRTDLVDPALAVRITRGKPWWRR
jgi:uncharacterized membrane protein YccC